MIEYMHISPKVAHDQRRSALDHGESLTGQAAVAGGGCSRPEYKSWFGGHDMGECLHGEKACKVLRKIFGRKYCDNSKYLQEDVSHISQAALTGITARSLVAGKWRSVRITWPPHCSACCCDPWICEPASLHQKVRIARGCPLPHGFDSALSELLEPRRSESVSWPLKGGFSNRCCFRSI
jgi:hypothetical protein